MCQILRNETFKCFLKAKAGTNQIIEDLVHGSDKLAIYIKVYTANLSNLYI